MTVCLCVLEASFDLRLSKRKSYFCCVMEHVWSVVCVGSSIGDQVIITVSALNNQHMWLLLLLAGAVSSGINEKVIPGFQGS